MPQKQPLQAIPSPDTSILQRMVSQAMILTAFVIVVLATLSFVISRSMLERSVRARLSSVAGVVENSVENTLHSHRERASLLTSNVDVLSILNGNGTSQTLARLLALLQRDQSSLAGIEVYDIGGRLLAGAGDQIGLPQEARNVPYHRTNLGESGWESYDVFTPIWAEGGVRTGYLALRYDTLGTLDPLFAVAPSLGDTAEINLVLERDDELQIMHPAAETSESYMLSLGSVFDQAQESVLLSVLDGTEGVGRAHDYRGRDALIAYRYLPTLGWGMTVQVERRSALAEVRSLAIAHSAIGTLLLLLAAALSWILANQLTQPLRLLTDRVRQLRPGAWTIKRSVETGDEVEVLDQVVVDMAARLKTVYDHQEEVIADRTKELKRQYALDRTILESIEYGVLTVDAAGKVTGSNPAATKLLMEKDTEMLGRDVEDVIKICGHRGNPLTGGHPVKDVLKKGETMRSPVNAHFNVRRNDEALIPVMYAITPLETNGKLFGAIIIFQDITEERRLDYLKSEFITLASHQLRTPLSALRWYIELFSDNKKDLDKEHLGYLNEMQHSAERMVALLDSLLHAAHLEGDNLQAAIQKTDLTQIMQELHDDCAALVHEAGLNCTLSVPDKPVIIETDPTLMRIVLQNLLTNAVKYTPQNSKKPIVLEMKSSASEVVMQVRDSGYGIPKDEQKRVFQKFFRAKNIRKRDTDGNGLGLYITRTIVDRLGGKISFDSAENEGTTFMVSFPVKVKQK